MLEKVYDPGAVESRWNKVWSESGVFRADAGSKAPSFTIIQPPPNITGMLTVGHALGSTIQDILIRRKRMSGFNTLWLPGIDHAGIATQNVVERHLEQQGNSREQMGREQFLRECWKWKDRYHKHIVEQEDKLGLSLDWSRETFTLDEGVSRAVREVFVRLYRKGLIYRDRYIINWCPACRTAISDEEVEYRDEEGKLYYISYPFAEGDGEMVVATTRPETMLGDVAVAISPDHPEADRLEGSKLSLPLTGRKIPVICDHVVDPEFGTACLKVTPAHDATDFEIGRRHKLEPVVVINETAEMNDNAGEFAGLDRYRARERILDALRERGLLKKSEEYRHSISRHDRCGTVIEPYISRQWFLKMKQLAAPAIEVVRKGEIKFYPARWKNIYMNWMENIRDWCISRQLWWGHRIPVWYCNECDEEIVSVVEPEKCPGCGSSRMEQDQDVLDTWFSSWLWTFSPLGWPEQTRDLATFHPTDVLVTAGDIIFFWVARMIMASLEFMNEIPFSQVYITGIVRDERGQKMSKSLGNSPDFIDIINRRGADAFRFTLTMLSPPGQDIKFDESRVDVGSHFANKIWNAARYVLGRDRGDELFPGVPVEQEEDLPMLLFKSFFQGSIRGEVEFGWEERWISSRFIKAAGDVSEQFEQLRFDEAARTIYDFFWHEYCDWYLELSKQIFSQEGARASGASVTARSVLSGSMALLHPIMPFITEQIWQMVTPDDSLLAGFNNPEFRQEQRDMELERDAGLFMDIVTSIRNMRQTFNVPSNRGGRVIINCQKDRSIPPRLEPFREQIIALTGTEEIDIGQGLTKPEGSAATGLALVEIYIPLRGLIDFDLERERLSRELDKLRVDCGKIGNRLENEQFLSKAPSRVIERERARYRDMSTRMKRIERILEDLD